MGGCHMKVDALVLRKGNAVATIRADQLVSDAVGQLTAANIGALVVSPDGRLVEGIISERDIVAYLDRLGPAVLDQAVASIMATDVRTCSPTDEMAALMAVMTNQRIRHLPVLDGGFLAGMVSIGDVVKARVDELEEDQARLLDYIDAR
jgi:CBS domain-containing protein